MVQTNKLREAGLQIVKSSLDYNIFSFILNNTKQDFIYQDYFNIASIFSFKEDDKVKILVSLLENKTLSQLEILFLLVKFKISYYIKYENFIETR